MIIKIDNREKKIISEIDKIKAQYNELTIDICTLELGDMIICDTSGNEVAIIERKSLKDLASSIRDGRYKEQGYRLNKCFLSNHFIYYLIEGDMSKYNNPKIPKTTLISAMTSISFNKGFSLIRTQSVKETAEFIMQMAKKIRKDPEPYNIPTGDKEQISNTIECYSDVVKTRTKKSNITCENIGEIMLSQIPGVSINIAKVIMVEFKTIKNLIKCIEEDDKCMDDIKIETKTKKMRKISKTAIKSIKKYLTNIK